VQGGPPQFPTFFGGNILFTFLGIFVWNLVLSAFVFVTLPGFVFFPVSGGMLVYRGFLWGVLLRYEPTLLFLVVLPTLVLEGEGYVLAAVGGTVAGVSWVQPKWVYKEEGVTRGQAFWRALGECWKLYAFVVIILLVAAVVETATLAMIT
jgi:hypothetical protein